MTTEEMHAQQMQQFQKEYDSMELPRVTEVPVRRELRIRMSDGVSLQTILFLPREDAMDAEGSWPVILQRSPYAADLPMYEFHGRNLAEHGFIYIVQFCRGTGESEGEWTPNVNERRDGLDTLMWLQNAPWVKNIGFWGASYLALTGWCMADVVPDKVKGMYLSVYGTDRFASAYCKGSFRQDVLTSWAMENAGYEVRADYAQSYQFRPQIKVDEVLWGRKLPWYRDWITAPKEEDPYWQQGFWKELRDIPGKVRIPIHIAEGWYDHHLGSALKAYESLGPEQRDNCALQIGCWNHGGFPCLEWTQPEDLRCSEVQPMTEWFTSLLMKNEEPRRGVSVYIIGRDEWREFPSWPMPSKETVRFHLTAEGTMTQDCAGEGVRNYVYDPEHPVPSHGTESMLHTREEIGSLYQPEPGYRSDVLSYVSGPLEEDLVIGGKVCVRLTVSSDCEDTAFTAKLMKIGADARAVNIRSSITTICADHPEGYTPGTKVQVEIDMWEIAFEVQKGERLRLDISSSDFPQYSVHSNYPGLWSMQEKTRIAHQSIYSSGEESVVEIPVLEL